MNRIIQVTLGLFVLLAALLTTSPAEARYSSYFEHGAVGNAQGIAVRCSNGAGDKWLLQGQTAYNKCGGPGVDAFYVPSNFAVCVRDYYNPGQGCILRYGGGTWWYGVDVTYAYAWSVAN